MVKIIDISPQSGTKHTKAFHVFTHFLFTAIKIELDYCHT